MSHETKLRIPKFPHHFIKPVYSENDLKEIEHLAKEIWNEYYPGIITKQQIRYMLRKMYSLQVMRNEVENNIRFYIIYYKKNSVGYFSISEKVNKHYFLHKFYLRSNTRARGLGTAVFRKILKIFNPKAVELTVNRQNFKAINFYFKTGFQIEKVEDFDIGNGFFMNDFVMIWKKKSPVLKRGFKE
jgi:ribosomal protein S18 acetylase RimI-like enzyme